VQLAQRTADLMEAPGRIQMAIDHWLLEQHKLGLLPSICGFTWSPPAISLGYHQSNWPEYWQQLTARRTLAVSTTSYGWTGSAAPGA